MKKTRILFVCHGNICRSPMAEFVMKHELKKRGLAERYEVASAGVSDEEHGGDIYPPARRMMDAHGIPYHSRHATLLRQCDYAAYEYIIGMDESNMRSMRWLFGGDPEGKLSMLTAYSGLSRGVADPWYTRDFDSAYADIEQGVKDLCDQLENKRA
ncbi:MAG: low molecular weight phosphotyrosine protein phosphatase [Ruminococcaceae bacterium]|nr:low molecular weight phosphotyrosine protein phosphatase [Oscillospiraceae bacterium]